MAKCPKNATLRVNHFLVLTRDEATSCRGEATGALFGNLEFTSCNPTPRHRLINLNPDTRAFITRPRAARASLLRAVTSHSLGHGAVGPPAGSHGAAVLLQPGHLHRGRTLDVGAAAPPVGAVPQARALAPPLHAAPTRRQSSHRQVAIKCTGT